MASTLRQIIAEEREATREELEQIFQRNITYNECPPHVLKYFKDIELKRLAILELYRTNVIEKGKKRTRMIHILCRLTGCHINTVNRWTIQYFGHPKSQQHGKLGSKV